MGTTVYNCNEERENLLNLDLKIGILGVSRKTLGVSELRTLGALRTKVQSIRVVLEVTDRVLMGYND